MWGEVVEGGAGVVARFVGDGAPGRGWWLVMGVPLGR